MQIGLLNERLERKGMEVGEKKKICPLPRVFHMRIVACVYLTLTLGVINDHYAAAGSFYPSTTCGNKSLHLAAVYAHLSTCCQTQP